MAGCILVVTAVFLQRFALPFVHVSVSLVVLPVVLVWLLRSRAAVVDETRARLYLAAVGAAALAATVSVVTRAPASMTSLLLLVVLYAALCIRVAPCGAVVYPRVLKFFTGAMSLVAVATVAQVLAQFVGLHYVDPLGRLPHALLLAGYNTSYPLHYGSAIMKPNGVFMLEPSFASQFLAMAVIVQLTLGGRPFRVIVCLVGMLLTVCGTGVVLLGVSLVALALRKGTRWAGAILLVTAVAAILLSLTPLGKLYGARLGEVHQTNSSATLRFDAPYARAASLTSTTTTLLVGNGPGFADRDAAQYERATGLPINYPAVGKLVVEYGLPVAILFVVFIGTVMFRGAPSPTLAVAAAVLYFALSGSLLQPHTVLLAMLFTGFFAAPRTSVPARQRTSSRRSRLPLGTLMPLPQPGGWGSE